MSQSSPFDDIRALVACAPSRNPPAASGTPRPGLGRLAEVARWVAEWQGRAVPTADRSLVCLFVSTHGGGLAPEAARARLASFTAGTATINAVCASGGLGFRAFDLAVDLPSGDIAHRPAMTERDCVATMAFGMEAVAGGADILALGDAALGADMPAAAILAALGRDPPGRWAEGAALDRLTAALLRDGGASRDPLATLASLGGRDIAALAGAILAARHGQVPVLIGGLPAIAAAAVLHALDPSTIGHCRLGHAPVRAAEAALVGRLGLEPILSGLDLPDGDAVAAALALGPVRAAIAAARLPEQGD